MVWLRICVWDPAPTWNKTAQNLDKNNFLQKNERIYFPQIQGYFITYSCRNRDQSVIVFVLYQKYIDILYSELLQKLHLNDTPSLQTTCTNWYSIGLHSVYCSIQYSMGKISKSLAFFAISFPIISIYRTKYRKLTQEWTYVSDNSWSNNMGYSQSSI